MKQRELFLSVLIGDLSWAVLAMGIAIVLRYGTHWSADDFASVSHLLHFLEGTCVIWVLLSFSLPLDGFHGGWQLSAVISHLLLAVGGVMAILLSCGYVLRSYVSRLVLFQFDLLLFVGFVLLRVSLWLLLRNRAKQGLTKRVVIVGEGRLVRELASKIRLHPEMLLRVTGFLTKDDGKSNFDILRTGPHAAQNGSAFAMVDVLRSRGVEELIFASEDGMSPDQHAMARACRDRGIEVSVVPQLDELYLSRAQLIDLDGLPLLRLAKAGLNRSGLAWKRTFDILLGIVFSVFAIPILVPFALALYFTTGKVFRFEKRCGLNGKAFAMLRLNVDRTGPRVSRLDEVLRSLSFSELPQLWNVLRGDMSLVGPRPESPERVCHYSEWQQQRLTVKPGITGLAQVRGLREQHPSEDKTRFDLQYLLSYSLWTDLALLLQTIATLIVRFISCAKCDGETESTTMSVEPVRLPLKKEGSPEYAHRT